MSERTIFCPTGCHKDYLERRPVGEGTFYVCQKCDWEAEWNFETGMRQKLVPSGLLFADDEFIDCLNENEI